MPERNQPLRVDPTELQVAADQLDAQASSFVTAHHASHSRAGHAALGAGLSAAALPEMLAVWDSNVARSHQRFAALAEDHRIAATKYRVTDAHGAEHIDDAGPAR
ncbi:hypothetical protein GCM10010409_20270 [Mycolicibacterium diernhoferi]|uniref:ESX-1 secretion-associated protein n=1 Tax=Mycolicibacterium diernhoferi TaxID=1801 RepID=A0A1Q4H7G3_9MYCO|nr:hypothetical protein BRW64_21905 [Mycolicibacterium diernhoferi]OPE56276.1 hypothetical protein BV510_00625 [Mycolicibacterium diernhoferi]PEG55506.1 ESX-1 secretion-associated protein [Mycolicibacterium diernhoferi]